jgi:hypothetical protein
MTKKTKRLLLSLFLLAVAGAVIVYFIWNKPFKDTQAAKPAYSLLAAELHNTFSTDSATAKAKYIGDENNGKVIQVKGEVAEVKINQANETVILLKTNTGGAFVNCTMSEKADGVKAGDTISIKGMCSGYLFEAEMGIPGDVTMVRCYIVK